MENILVADIMTREPICVKPEADLLECARKMVRKRVGSLLITKKKHLVGFISQEDILWALIKKSKKGLSEVKAIDISPKKIATIKPSFTIKEAIKKMKKLKFERLPVIHDKKLVGMITIKDILNFNPEFYPELEEFAEIKEETNKLKRLKKLKGKTILNKEICEECGNLDFLYKTKDAWICESCKNSL